MNTGTKLIIRSADYQRTDYHSSLRNSCFLIGLKFGPIKGTFGIGLKLMSGWIMGFGPIKAVRMDEVFLGMNYEKGLL